MKPWTTISIQWDDVDIVEDYKHSEVHMDNKQDWVKNTTPLYRKGQSCLYFLRWLRSFNICHTILRIFLQIFCGQCHPLCYSTQGQQAETWKVGWMRRTVGNLSLMASGLIIVSISKGPMYSVHKKNKNKNKNRPVGEKKNTLRPMLIPFTSVALQDRIIFLSYWAMNVVSSWKSASITSGIPRSESTPCRRALKKGAEETVSQNIGSTVAAADSCWTHCG